MSAARPPSPAAARPWLRLSANARRRLAAGIRIAALLALVVWALATPGFTSSLNIFSTLTSMSFIGCVAVGMTFITISGNLMSLCLGATLSVTAMVFLGSLGVGVAGAFAAAILSGIAITAAQGFLIGYFRANAILVSIAALSLILGIAELVAGGHQISPAGPGSEIFKGRILGIPREALIFFACVAAGQIVLSSTRAGRGMRMIGSNRRAAAAAGIEITGTITWAYVMAGAFTAVAGVLLAARYGAADMDLGANYDYGAIAAVLVGGTGIAGGSGSVVRTLLGVAVIATVEGVLLLRGFDQQMQYLINGLIVLGVVMLHSLGESR